MTMNRKKTARFVASFFLVAAFLVPAVFPGGVQAQKIELSIAHQAPPTFVYQIISEKFKEMLESKTGDKVKVNIFHSGQLGQEKEYIEGQMMGTADIALVTSGLLTLWEPLMVYIDLPYLYRDVEHANKVANGPIGEEINKKLEKHGIMVLVCGDMGFQSLYNRKKPINKPDDFAGMKIRVIQNPMQIDLMNAWGAQPVPMNFGEVYSALQQGVIDAAANEPYTYDIVKHYEVASYYSITNHLHKMYAMTMSKKRFDALPKDVQQAILETARALLPVSTKITTEIDLKIIGKLIRENRVLFNTADVEAFRKLSQGVLDKWSEKVGKETVDKIKAVK